MTVDLEHLAELIGRVREPDDSDAPWTTYETPTGNDLPPYQVVDATTVIRAMCYCSDDASLLAAARTAIPALVERVRMLERSDERMRTAMGAIMVERDDAQARIRELEAALRAVLDDESNMVVRDNRCASCWERLPAHTGDCPVGQARALLEGKDA